MSDKICVSKSWYEEVIEFTNKCPFCKSERSPIIKKEDEKFYSQRGCLDCDTWIDPVRFK